MSEVPLYQTWQAEPWCWEVSYNIYKRVLDDPYKTDSQVGESALQATQGQIDGFLSKPLYKWYLEEVASVGD